MIKYKSILILFAGLFLISLACAPRVAQAPEKEVVEKPKAPQAKTSWEQQWEGLIKEAQKEGTLSMYVNLEPEDIEDLRKNFGEKYRINLEILSARGSEMAAKITMERMAGLYIPDVFVGGHTTALLDIKPKGLLQSLDGIVFRPDVLDKKLWWRGYGPYFDKDHKVGGGTRNVQPPLLINTDMVKPGEITSYSDLLNPRWKGKIILLDPVTIGGAETAIHFMLLIMGEDYLKKFVDQVDVIIRDKKQGVEWVVRGKYPISLGSSSGLVDEYEKAGVTNVEMILLKEGTGITGTGVVVVFDRAPHPAAAKLFTNWFLTKEGQEIFAVSTARVSRRLDASQEHIPKIRWMKEGAEYIVQDEEFLETRNKNQPIVEKYFKK